MGMKTQNELPGLSEMPPYRLGRIGQKARDEDNEQGRQRV